MDFPVFESSNLKLPTPNESVDSKQLQNEVQHAFNACEERIKNIETIVLLNLELHKTVLSVLLDREIVDLNALIDTLEEIKEKQTDDFARIVVADLIVSFKNSFGTP
ncbi:hypothetical protein [Pseudosulfitobacter pseudonitzschiae]|uniref:hypothetical protein n=1 Tax=Pseudosulfitobacter pseudonitzschiae TaxID=1402135 RepID=UPI001AF7E6E5|nr:hypothetical protein [Pseudosulfitobacter pseudonitzschiae]MBM1814914.1 hypothetical protein [Pseudosulfitobacter pseudonitzschiae]MBM1831908.1 hypothetical protein [Pseudosulfitobacter pseudonitzschiae]MBM1836773.1 hypothetical protein [Pseudosulfitobacter pseudonitzschiae]MBM1841620.1 hypothetical protein [Pseudosulfitobacter pseudonitzschiae]MBM1846487.1 hypothetical protein [Pseudosulfitobacter pseudonitzschiae]